MNTIQGIKRLGWRFSEASKQVDKSFTVNQKDIEALKAIAKEYEKPHIINNSKDELIYRMYIFIRAQIIFKMGGDPYDEICQKETVRLLLNPVDFFIDQLIEFSNLNEYSNICEKKGINVGHPATLSIEKKESDLKKMKALSNEELIRFLGGFWKKEDIGDNLLIELNNIIKSIY